MATLKQRLHKKNSSGTYDVVHLETSASLVLMSDGTTAQATIDSLKTSVSNGKSAVASAITDKGISTSATVTFDTMASNIGKIETSSAVIVISNLTRDMFNITNGTNSVAVQHDSLKGAKNFILSSSKNSGSSGSGVNGVMPHLAYLNGTKYGCLAKNNTYDYGNYTSFSFDASTGTITISGYKYGIVPWNTYRLFIF